MQYENRLNATTVRFMRFLLHSIPYVSVTQPLNKADCCFYEWKHNFFACSFIHFHLNVAEFGKGGKNDDHKAFIV